MLSDTKPVLIHKFPADLWNRVKARAALDGSPVSSTVIKMVQHYLDAPPTTRPAPLNFEEPEDNPVLPRMRPNPAANCAPCPAALDSVQAEKYDLAARKAVGNKLINKLESEGFRLAENITCDALVRVLAAPQVSDDDLKAFAKDTMWEEYAAPVEPFLTPEEGESRPLCNKLLTPNISGPRCRLLAGHEGKCPKEKK